MSYDLVLVLVVLVLTVVLFATERLPVDVVALLALGVLLVTGVLPPEEALAGFSNEAVVTIGAMFVLSAGLYRSGALNQLRKHFEATMREDRRLALLGLMVTAGVTSAFVNNTAVVAILIPMVLATSQKLRVSASKYLMPLSFAAMFGGVCTLIGTSTNLLVSTIAAENGLEPFGMFEFTLLGLAFFVTGAVYMMTIGERFVPARRGIEDLADSWRVAHYVCELVLSPKAQSVGKPLSDAPLTQAPDLDVIQIRREGAGLLLPSGDTVFEAGDELLVRCNVSRLQELLLREGVLIQPRTKWEDQDLGSADVVLVEVVIAPHSGLEGETLRSSEFRNRFGGTVIALQHRGTLVQEALADLRLRAGDGLLVETTRRRLPQFGASEAFVVVSEVPRPEFEPSKAVPAIAILTSVVGLATAGVAPIVVTACGGAIAMILFGCLTAEDAYRAIDWKVIFLLAGVLALGAALERTGGAELLSRGLILGVGGLGPVALVSTVYLVTTLLTNTMSNNATAVLLAPIAIAAAADMNLDPRPFLMAVTFAASASFMTPVGYQTNTMIYGPGQYRFMDFVRVGGPLNLIFWVLASLLIPLLWPL